MNAPGYPHAPGWRRSAIGDTSREAAERASVKALSLKDRVLAMLASGPASPEELTARFAEAGETVLLNTIRARCTDLHKLGKLRPSGSFGRGESGKTRVIRWEIVPETEGRSS